MTITRYRVIFAFGLLFLLQSTAFCQATLTLNGRVRDFNAFGSTNTMVPGHPDFERGITGLKTGLVNQTLGVDGLPVFSGFTGGNIQSTTSFNQWYRDVPGVNEAMDFPITLSGPTIDELSFTNGNFFPIDTLLLGSEGRSHNYHFTYEFTSSFRYFAGRNQRFSFSGDDDVWFFVNNQLAFDLGGVHARLDGSVLMDAFASNAGLVDGGTYEYKLFFAERQTSSSYFSITSSLGPAVPEPSSVALLTIAIPGICFSRRARS